MFLGMKFRHFTSIDGRIKGQRRELLLKLGHDQTFQGGDMLKMLLNKFIRAR